ncbi:hypothetical protein [Chryseobacterium paridis]|uniref:VanZ-like domain-containing protein n=1 Tax=Chryseobacterium paridis TaxID=2800328 RepID=A0ABS1FZF5_9FLAO|nr:hypothetical protein [Chryseobacterium paridis]MBK1897794.1 hypothetical protein [Chryseobacterium paridis]
MNKILGFHWKPNLKFIITSIVYLSILFEVLCPSISDKFIGDIFDVVAYFMGGIGYYFFQIHPQKSKLFF